MTIPFFPYKLFFLYIDPMLAIGGAVYMALQPRVYLTDLEPDSGLSHSQIPTAVLITIYALSNLFLVLAINTHLVLSSTESIKTWKRYVFGLLVADFGHLISVFPLGFDAYWKYWEWNGMMWGNYGLIYATAAIKLSFLLGIGLKHTVVTSTEHSKKI